MSPIAVKPREPAFSSAEELKSAIDRVLGDLDADDPEAAARLAAVGPLQIEFTDLDVVLNLGPGKRGGRMLEWDYSRRSRSRPKLLLAMESSVANRFLQGRENPAIAIARGRLQASCGETTSALRFFPAVKPVIDRYRTLVASEYPHLAVD